MHTKLKQNESNENIKTFDNFIHVFQDKVSYFQLRRNAKQFYKNAKEKKNLHASPS